jgi:hypothetical protein
MSPYAEPGELQCIGPTPELHNAHVLLFYRWNIWLAATMGRLFHQTMLTEWHNEELARASADRS